MTTDELFNCDVLLVFEDAMSIPFNIFQLSYDIHPDPRMRDIYVEPTSFIENCINENYFALGRDRKAKMGMPGRKHKDRHKSPGSHRTEFTLADDENLCRYLGMRVPDPSSGGRSGDNIYQELVNLVSRNYVAILLMCIHF